MKQEEDVQRNSEAQNDGLDNEQAMTSSQQPYERQRSSDTRQVQILENQNEVFEGYDVDDQDNEGQANSPGNDEDQPQEDDQDFMGEFDDDNVEYDVGGSQSRHGTENESQDDSEI